MQNNMHTFLKQCIRQLIQVAVLQSLFSFFHFLALQVEKVDNEALMAAFQKKKKMMEGRNQREPMSRRLFQQVPQQFCEVVCRVGFQRMYSAPCGRCQPLIIGASRLAKSTLEDGTDTGGKLFYFMALVCLLPLSAPCQINHPRLQSLTPSCT